MKTYANWLFAPLAVAFGLAAATTALAAPLQINPKLKTDPLIVNGTSGGTKSSNCGNIAHIPNHVIQVPESLPYLQLRLQSTGQPTLLIEGPSGRFCVLGDAYASGHPEISGYWQAGVYSLYVGDRAQGHHPYTLSISEKRP